MTAFKNYIRNNLMTGILIAAPIGASVYLILFILKLTQNVERLIPHYLKPETHLGFEIPGLGLFLAVVLLVLIGTLGRIYFVHLLLNFGEKIIHKIPLIRTVYSAVKQLLDTIAMSQSTGKAQKVAMIEYPRKGIYSVVFVTSEAKGETQMKTESDLVNVFLPTTPNPTSGFFLMVPKTDLTYMDMTVEEAFKLIMSGGIVTPPQRSKPQEEQA